MKTLRKHRQLLGWFMTCLMALWLPAQNVRAATLVWDGGANTWDAGTTLYWNSGGPWVNSNDNIALFGGSAGTVTLGAPITAGGLTFNSSGYTITGGGNALTLAAPTGSAGPVVSVGTGNSLANTGTAATLNAQLSGVSGFTKTGNGTLKLGNANNYTGVTTVRNGVLSITSQAQLGSSTTTVGVQGVSTTDFTSGGLQVQGGSVNNAGITFTRELSLAGRGNNAMGSGVLNTIGNNTYAGDILAATGTEARIALSAGLTTFSGRITTGGSNLLIYGNGSAVISGQIVGGTSGVSALVKGGTGINSTLILTNNNNTTIGAIRAEGGTIRVSDGGQLGLANNTGSASGGNLNFNGGTFEIRSDTPGSFATKNISQEFNTGTIFVDHALTSSLQNQTFAFANFRQENNRGNFIFTGRNGSNVLISAFTGNGNGNNAEGYSNTGNGLVTFTGDIWGEGNNNQTLTMTATGEMLLTGNITASATTNSAAFNKAGTGTMTIQGTAGTFNGSGTISAGTLNISNIGALNASSISGTAGNTAGRVVFGGGTLNYTGAAQTWTSKVLLLNAGNGILTNNGTGALVLPQNVGNNGTGVKNLVLGGSNTGVNDLQGLVVNTTAQAGLTKFDSGTWQISSPGTTAATIGTANATFGITAITASTNGTQTITTTSTSGLAIGQPVSGAGIAFGTVISQIISPTQFAVSQAVATTGLGNVGATINLGTVTGSTAALSVSANTANVLTVASTANLVPGQPISGPGMTTGGWYISAINSATTFTVANTTGAAALANNAAIGSQTPALSPNFAGPLTISGGTVILNPLNGTDEVINNSSNLVFGTDPIRGSQYAGGTLNYKAFSTGSSETMGILTATAGNGTVQITPTAGTNSLTFGSITAPAVGSSLNFLIPASPGTNSVSITAPPAVGLLNAHAYYNGADFVYNPTTGSTSTLRAPVYGTDAGFNTVAAAASLTAASNNQITTTSGTSGAVSSGVISVTSLKLNGGTSLALTGALTVGGATGGGVLVDGGSATISGTGITTGSAGDLVFRVNGSSDALNLSAPMTATTTGGFTKNGEGRIILTAANLQTGTNTINQGAVRISGATATIGNPAAGNQTVIRQEGTLELSSAGPSGAAPYTGGTALPIAVVAPVLGSGAISNLTAGPQAISFGTSASTAAGVFSSVLSDGAGTLSVIRNGASGVQALTGLNTYTGQTVLSGGATLQATSLANGGAPSSIGASSSAASNLVFNGGTLLYQGSSTTVFQSTQTPSVSTDRQFTLAGNGTIQSSGTYGNNIFSTAGAANNASLIFTSTADITYAGAATARTLTLGGTSIGDNEMRIHMIDNGAGALSITKANDASLWILNPSTANTYSGATTISGGQLRATDGVGLSSNSNLTLNGGVLETTGSFSRSLGTTGGAVQWTAAANGGFAASTGPLTVNIGGAGGTLVWNSTPQFATTGTVILNSSTALDVVTLVNPIDFNGANRTITVNDNGNTGADYAILTGVLSNGTGTGGLIKNGGGLLYITGANTYNGNTFIDNGQVAVTSIGSGGASSNFGNASGTLTLGAVTAGANGTYLLYYGAGETVTRPIVWNSTTGATTIDNSGSGPLSIGTFSITGSGAKTLNLRGFNTDANTISAVIADSGGVTTVTKSDGGTWILAGNNTYTGNTNVSTGFLGIGGTTGGTSGNPLPGNLVLGGGFINAGIFATNPAGLTISSTVTVTQGQTSVFAGNNSITLSGGLAQTTGGDPTIANDISGGTLTISPSSGALTGENNQNRTTNFRGVGNTNWNAALNLNGTGTMGLNISVAPTATFTIGGATVGTSTGTVTLTGGNLILARNSPTPFGNAATGLFAFNGGTLTANNALTGANAISNPVQINGSPVVVQGTNSIEFGNATAALALGASRNIINNMTGGASLIIGGGGIVNSAASTLGILGSGNTTINGVYAAGTGASALAMNGSGTLTLTANNAYTGATTLNSGTTILSGNGRVGGTSGITINQGATFTLDNTSGNPGTADRLGNKPLTLNGANVNFIGNSAGSTEGTAGNTVTTGSGQTTINVTNNGGTTQMNFTTLSLGAGSGTNFTSNATLGTATNRIIFSTAPTLTPATTGILARATVAGADFATYGANGIAAFTGYATPANVNTAAATDTLKVNGATTNTVFNATTTTVNALALDGSGLSFGATLNTDYQTVALTSGGLLNTTGNNTITSTLLNLPTEGAIHVASGTNLTIAGAVTGTGGFTKNLPGTLTLSGQNFATGTVTVNNGTLELTYGNNTLFPGQALTVNQNGVVNLNNSTQYLGALAGGTNPGSGGTINMGSGLLVVAGNTTFAGSITGSGNFARLGGNNNLIIESPLAYSGTTTLMTGTLFMRDNATLLNTSAIDINYANLQIDNNNNFQTDISNRVSDTAPITLRGGTITYNGRVFTNATETLGALTLDQGSNAITLAAGGGGNYNSNTLTFASLTRNAGTTMNFSGTTLGLAGNSSFINFTNAPSTVGNLLLGSWAIAGSDNYAAFNPAMGVGAVGTNGFTQYDTQQISTANVAPNSGVFAAGTLANIISTANSSILLPAGTTTTDMLRISGAFTTDINFTAGSDTLNLALGGLLRGNNANNTTIGTTAIRGNLTSGTGELVAYISSTGTTTINSLITGATALVKSGSGALTLTAPNTYSLGTVVDQGTLTISPTTPGDVVIPNGGLTINGSIVGAGTTVTQSTAGSIGSGNAVTVNGRSTLTLAGNNTLVSLTLNNNGGETNGPTVTPTGILTLTSNTPVTATSSNAATTATIGTGTLSLATGANTFNIAPIAIGSQTYTSLQATVNITSVITGTNVSISKTGNGVLGLAGASTFTNGVNLTTGGLLIGASSTPSARLPASQPTVASGPLGTGTLTISGGTTLLSSAANTVTNLIAVSGNFDFNGGNNLTLNGDTNLGGATRTIGVINPAMTATLGGAVSNGGVIKTGLGTLVLNNLNSFGVSDTVRVDNGILAGQFPGGAVATTSLYSPFGAASITYNGGVLSLRSQSGDAVFGNVVNVNSALDIVNLDVQAAGSTITMGSLNLPMTAITGAGTPAVTGGPTAAQVNITGTAGSVLRFPTTTLSGNNDGGSALTRTAGQFQTFNVGSGVTTILMDAYARNNEPLNIGTGTLILGGANLFPNGTTITASGSGAAPLANATTAIYGTGQTVTLSGGTVGTPIVYSIVPQTNTVIGGSSSGGLEQTATNTSASTLNAAGAWGLGATSIFAGDLPNDAALDRVLHTNASLSTLGVYNGYLNITTAGDYKFLMGSDDYSSLVIDGVEVGRDIGVGHGVQDTARGGLFLSAGQHSITFKINVGTGTAGGGGRLLYSGPDTVAGGTNGGWQAISGSRLSYFTGPANAGNNFYNAAQIDNDYSLSAGSVFTLQGLGSDYNTTVKSLTMGNGSQLNVTNDQGTSGVGGAGFIGVKGITTLGTTTVVNPTSANLYLIGGINDGGNGLTKASTSTGTLSLNNSTNFTGAFAINGGTVVLRESNALSTGGNTVASGASIDLYGVGSSAGRAITLNGTGTASQIGAIYNSQATAASVAGNITLNANSQIAGYGEISLTGSVTSAAGVTLTKAGSDTLTLTASNTATLLGPVTVAGGILNNGTLNAGTADPLGVGAITVNAGAVLNLSGNNIGQAITTNGTSIANTGPNGNTLGNLINSSISSSVSVRNTVTAGNNMMQLANTANTATISGNITMNTGTLGIGSNTFATGGDIIVTGVMSGTQSPTKVGGNTVTLRGVNTFAGGPTLNYGTLKLDNGGVFNGTGGAISIRAGSSLVLDNTGTLTQNRLNNNVAANNRNLSLDGGTLSILGNSSTTALNELISASVTAGNTSGILINQGMNNINLTVASSTAGAITLTATRAGTNADFQNANAGTVLITGRRLGLDAVGTAGSTNLVLTNGATTGVGLAMVGQNSNTALGGAAASTNKGLAAYALVDDGTVVDFATIGTAATGIRALASGTGNAAERTAAAATLATTANLNSSFALASAATVNSTTSPNSLKFTAGGSLTLGQGTTLNVQSGGILATASATISGPGIIGAEGTNNASATAAAQNLYIWSYGAGTTLTINAAIGSLQSNTGRTNELIKAGAGTLVLGGSNFLTTNTRVQEGTLTINNASAIYYRPANPGNYNSFAGTNVGPALQVNNSAVVNMNGFDLPLNNLSSINPGGVQGSMSGGTITNSGTNKNLTINTTGNNTWSGVIAADINFNKYGNSTFTVSNSNTFDGTTIIGGGATTMVDLGAFRSTSGVTINDATLIWNDNGSQSDPYRLGATPASVTLNGGGFQYNGRSGESSVANLGAVTLNSGANAMVSNAATLGSATVQMTSLTRTGNATINFTGSLLGDDGNFMITGTAPTLYNGILGGWAISSTANSYNPTGAGDFVTYDPVTGIRAIVDYMTTGGLTYTSGNNNQSAFGAGAFGAGNNIRVNSNTTLNTGANVVNSMVIGVNATTTLTFGAPTDTLFVQSGGILGSTDGNAKNIGGATAPTAANLNGYITAGNSNGSAGAGNSGYELFLHNLGNTMTVNSQIVDNGTNPVTLITTMGSLNGVAIRLNNTNTYTGSTIVQTTDLRLNSTFAPAIANSLDIRILGGTEGAADSSRTANNRIFFEQGNQLNSSANVLIANGSANLDLNTFNQTLNNITFNNIGGHTGNASAVGPHIRTSSGVLTLTGGITATNLENTSTVPFIMGNIALPAGQHTIQVDPLTYAPNQIGLSMQGGFSGAGGINKTGTGIFAIASVNTYTGPTNVNNGTLVLGGVAQDGATDTSASIAFSRVTVASGATIDMRGGNALIGSLAGAGTVTNSVYAMINNSSNGNVGVLTIGADNTSGANFSGVFTNFINGANETTGFGLNVNKVGTGNQIISGDNAASISSATVNGDMNNVGTLDIQDGTITVNGANGSLGFTTINIRPGATLTLDNSTAVKANRLGGFRLSDSANGDTLNDTTTGRTINVAGGILNFNAGSALMNEGTSATLAMGTNNGIGTVTLVTGNSTWNFNGGTNNGVTVNANAFTAGSGSLQLNAGATQTLGRAAAGTNSINVYVNGGMVAPQAQGSGTLSTGAPVAAAAGLVGGNFSGIGIRPDITGTDSTGSGFVTYDRYGFRLLTSSEYAAFPVQPNSPLTNGATGSAINPATAWANPNLTSANSLASITSAAAASGAAGPTSITMTVANAANVNIGQYLGGTGVPGGVRVTAVNYATGVITVTPWTASAAVAANATFTYANIPNVIITEGQSFTTGNTVASIRLDNGGGLTSTGGSNSSATNFNALGALNTTTVSSGLILANSGNTGLNGGAISAGGSALRLSVDSGATLNADTFLISTAVGTALIKEGSGTLNLNKQVYLGSSTDAGQLVVNGGTVNLNSGANTLTVVNSAGVSIADNLNINPGGTVDLKGFSQTIGTLNSNDATPGGGGTLTNSVGTANLYLSAASGTFGGVISGGINLFKAGANNQVLSNASTYTGTTTVQGGILLLQDSGTLASTTYNLYGGQLRFENRPTSLSEVVQRIPAGSTMNLRSGTFLDLARPTPTQVTQALATVNADQGLNQLQVDSGLLANRTLSISNLNVSNGAQIHFTTGAGTLANLGASPNIAFSNFSPTTMINGVIPWAVVSSDQPAMYNPVINPLTGVAYGVGVPNLTTNAAVSITGTNVAAASGAAGPTTITVTPAQAATVAVGTYLTGTGVPSGVLVTGVNTGTGVITVAPWTATAAVAANQSFTYTGGTANYQNTAFTATTTQNVNLGAAANINEAAVTTSRVFNSLRFSSTTATAIGLGRSELFRLEAGLIISNQSNLTFNNGSITAGVAANVSQTLYTFQNANSLVLNNQIVNNGTGVLTLVKGGGGSLNLNPQQAGGGSQTGAASNSTVAGSTTLTLSAAPPGFGVSGTASLIGQKVYGPGIANGTTIVGVSGSTITLSLPALATQNAGTFGFGDAVVGTTNIAAAANGAALPTTFNVTNAQAAALYVGSNVQGVGFPTGVNITAIGAADSGGAGFTTITTNGGTANAAVVANQSLSFGTATQISTNNTYTGATIVNQGTLNLNGAVGSRSLGGSTILGINNGGAVAMTNAGQISPATDVTINGGGTLTFTPVTSVEPTSGQINAINSLTFNNNGGTVQPLVAGGTNGIVTVKSGLITSNSDNQGTVALVSGVLNFGQVSLGSWGSGVSSVTVTDVAGFVAGQTITGTGIAAGTTISSISGNVLNLSAATTAASAATGSLLSAVNQPSGSTSTMTPTLAVNTTDVNELSADLVVSAVVSNSPAWPATTGAALTKTGNGTLVLSGASTFNNGFALTAGTLTLGASSTPTTGTVTSGPVGTGVLTISGGTTILSDSTTRTIANNIAVSGDFSVGGQQAGNSVVFNGTVDLGSSNRNITVTNPTVTATLGGVVSGSGGLTKSGNGTLSLGAANTYTGGTTINAGLVSVGNAAALGSNQNDLTVKSGGTLNVNGFSVTVDGLNGETISSGGLITNAGAAATLTVGNNNESSATFAGTITNAGNALNIVKTGTGTQVLTGINTYTGTTTVNAGVLQIGTNTSTQATSGTGAITVNSGGTLAGTGHILAPSAGVTLTVASGGVIAPGDTAGTANGSLRLGSLVGDGLQPQLLTTVAASPSSVSGPVNLTVSNGGQIQLGITAPTLNSADVASLLTAGTYTTASAVFSGLSAINQQQWNGQGWTQIGVGVVGASTLTYTGLANAIGLGNAGGNGSVFVGQSVSGTGIPVGTTITSITTGTNPVITLSQAITAAPNAITLNGTSVQNVNIVAGLNTITLADVAGLTVGNTVTGYGIPAGAVIASINGNSITLKDSVTNASVTPLASTTAPVVSFAAPGNHDRLFVTGTLTLGTNTSGTVSVVDNGYISNAVVGDVFNLLDWSAVTTSGTFTAGSNFRQGGTGGGDLNLPTLSTGLFWDVSAFTSQGILVVVPEPSRALFLMLGLLGFMMRRRRKAI